MIDVILPQLGESVSEGTISKWLVREGEVVKKDQALASIATDKADSDLPSPAGGRVSKLLAAEGDVVPVKTVIARIDENVQTPSASVSAAPIPVPVAVARLLLRRPPPPLPPRKPQGEARPVRSRRPRAQGALENDVDLDASRARATAGA